MRILSISILFLLFLAAPARAAFTLDASSDNIQIADNAALTFPDSDWSIWVRIKQTTPSAYFARFVACNDTTALNNMGLGNDAGNGDVGFWVQDGDGTFDEVYASLGTFPNDADWHDLVLVRSGNTFTLYLDGTSVATLTNSNVDAINCPENMYIGNRGGGTQDRGVIGSIVEFAKWDRALTSAEISGLSADFSSNCYQGLQVYVPMIVNSVELIKGLSITLTSVTTGTAHPRFYFCGE